MTKLERTTCLLAAAVALLATLPLAADETSLQGEWRLDAAASKNVPEAQKGVDLKITIKGNQLTTIRVVGDKPVGAPLVLTLDGTPRSLEIAPGQNATVDARWLERGKTIEQNVKMPGQAGLPVTQKTISQLSNDGMTMTRAQEIRQAGETTERTLIYRRKTQ